MATTKHKMISPMCIRLWITLCNAIPPGCGVHTLYYVPPSKLFTHEDLKQTNLNCLP